MDIEPIHAAPQPADTGCGRDCQRHLDAVLERQARAIGQMVHDEAGQILAVAYLALAEVARDAPPEIGERLRNVKAHLGQVEEHLRRVAHDLHPAETGGTAAALAVLGRAFEARHGIRTEVRVVLGARLPDAIGIGVHRIAQEGLTNIARHARAKHVSIRVSVRRGAVLCAIRDDGAGFDASAMSRDGCGGLGLTGMRKRVEALGGLLTIRSAPGEGTRLTATIPLGH